MSQCGGNFSLSDEILAVIPTDPYDQLDLARKITSMAIASRVSNLESQVSGLRQKLLQKDRFVLELEDKVSSFERLYHEAESSLKNVVDENMKLTQERDSLAITAKKLGRDFAKLDAFKRQLMQSLNDENPSQTETADVRMVPRDKAKDPETSGSLQTFQAQVNEQKYGRFLLMCTMARPLGGEDVDRVAIVRRILDEQTEVLRLVGRTQSSQTIKPSN